MLASVGVLIRINMRTSRIKLRTLAARVRNLLVRVRHKRRFSNWQSLLKTFEIIRPALNENEGALLVSSGHRERHDVAGNFEEGVR